MRFFVFVMLLLSQIALAQTKISGKLVDDLNKPISNVSVTYKKVGDVALLGFGRSDNNGLYSLSVKVMDVDSVQLDFQHMNYAKKSVVVANRTANYSYQLVQQAREIGEVKVGNMPIYKRKDTINYDVNAFTSKQDRVIADIIKKLPGIEMRGDQILYQGKPIQKYMVDNLDLMEGRYGLINNNLPADAVKKVQVVENDQPIKILDSLVFSDRASLNLELKKFTTTGTGKVGVGYQPVLWDLNLTPMTFGKTFQMVNSLQTNNTGYDASKDLRAFYTGGMFFGTRATISNGESFLAVRNVSSPSFDEKKWLDNKIFLFSTNTLQKFKSGVELKGNLSYYHDTRKREGFTATQYFTTDEIIYSSEHINNNYRNQVFDVGLLLEKNEKNIFLRNSTKFQKKWNKDLGNLFFNNIEEIGQDKRYTDEAFMNNLSMARFIGKQLVNINSTITYNKTPQQLVVNPGQFEDLLNEGNPYEQMSQQVLFKKISVDNSLGFTRKVKYWTITPTLELNYDNNKLNTAVEIANNGQQKILGQDYINDMDNSQLNLALIMRIGWEKAKWKFNIQTPYRAYYFNVLQQGVKTLDNELKNTFNPSASLTYLMNSNNEFSSSLSAGNSYGGLNNFYNGYIISQYRNMQRYDARLLRTDNRSASVGYNYKNTLKANFANFRYSYSEGERDYIFSSSIDELGRRTTTIVDQGSRNLSHNLSGGVSHFFSSFKTVVKLNASINWSISDYLLNGVLDKQRGRGQSGSVEVINSLSTIISGDYKTTYGRNKNIFSTSEQLTIYNNHYLNVVFYPSEKHSLIVSNSLYTNNMKSQKDQYFLDLTYRYRVDKWKTDIELNGQNLLNNSQFVQQFSNTIELVQSTFELRPRQFVISTRFKF
ncbi:hypothetical protein EDC17_104125 [Sphingobacterium alimentarium]|uniref:Carboxypeptidase-like protein n=1 Tax=Sphingobacterium alimentarium TaxID=797292 RepID=A0A4R3VVQ2_9SPHI|nr:TonB-dependent receptor [Sphingobacterium alimentarium]TCV09617.1 hypothetical protein EDC17_104125 [Sphingobacterium alimentarium]